MGDAKETCGGDQVNSVYPVQKTPARNLKDNYLGCFLDNAADRDLNGKNFFSTNMRIDSCVQFCTQYNYNYSGLQNG